MHTSKGLHIVAYLLLVIGGLNWLLYGLFMWHIGLLFGGDVVARGLYVLVGIAAIYELFTHKQSCKHCSQEYHSTPSTPPTPDHQV